MDDQNKNNLEKAKQFIKKHRVTIACCGITAVVSGKLAGDFVLKGANGTFREIMLAYGLDPSNPAEFPLILGTEAFEALVNGETNFVRFTSELHPHVFRVSLEQ